MWAALLTSQVPLRAMAVYERIETKKWEFHRLCPQMYQGTSVPGNRKYVSTTPIL